MSDTSTQSPATTDDVAALRAAADRGLAAERQVAFLLAGVDIADPLRANLMATYTGPNDADAVKAHLDLLGVTPAKETAPPAPVDDGQQQMRDVLNGTSTSPDGLPIAGQVGTPGGDTPPAAQNPVEAAWAEFYAPTANRNRSLEHRQLVLIDKHIVGAVEGVPGFRFDAEEWRAETAAAGHDFRPMHMQGQPVALR